MRFPELNYREWSAVAQAYLALAVDVYGLGELEVKRAQLDALKAISALNELEQRRLWEVLLAAAGDAYESMARERAKFLQRDLFTDQVDRAVSQVELQLSTRGGPDGESYNSVPEWVRSDGM